MWVFGFPFWREMSCFHGATLPTWCTFGCFFQDTPPFPSKLWWVPLPLHASISSPPPKIVKMRKKINHPLLTCPSPFSLHLHYQTPWDLSLYSNCETTPFASNLPHISCICLFLFGPFHFNINHFCLLLFASIPIPHALFPSIYTWGRINVHTCWNHNLRKEDNIWEENDFLNFKLFYSSQVDEFKLTD